MTPSQQQEIYTRFSGNFPRLTKKSLNWSLESNSTNEIVHWIIHELEAAEQRGFDRGLQAFRPESEIDIREEAVAARDAQWIEKAKGIAYQGNDEMVVGISDLLASMTEEKPLSDSITENT